MNTLFWSSLFFVLKAEGGWHTFGLAWWWQKLKLTRWDVLQFTTDYDGIGKKLRD